MGSCHLLCGQPEQQGSGTGEERAFFSELLSFSSAFSALEARPEAAPADSLDTMSSCQGHHRIRSEAFQDKAEAFRASATPTNNRIGKPNGASVV